MIQVRQMAFGRNMIDTYLLTYLLTYLVISIRIFKIGQVFKNCSFFSFSVVMILFVSHSFVICIVLENADNLVPVVRL